MEVSCGQADEAARETRRCLRCLARVHKETPIQRVPLQGKAKTAIDLGFSRAEDFGEDKTQDRSR